MQKQLLAVCLIVVTGSAIYSNTLKVEFVFDDIPNIVNNPNLRISGITTDQLFPAVFRGRSHRRPIANLSFALNDYFSGREPRSFHIVNMMIHLANGVLVYFLSLQLFGFKSVGYRTFSTIRATRTHICALLTALIFVVHPVQTQAVTYIVQRMTCLATLFCLLAVYLFILGRQATSKQARFAWWIAALISWVLALGSKEFAVIIPVLLVAYEFYFFDSSNRHSLVKALTLGIVILATVIMIGIVFLGSSPLGTLHDTYAFRDFNIFQRILTQFRVVNFYITLLLFPSPARLNLMHIIETSISPTAPWTTLLSITIVMAIVGITVHLAKHHHLYSFCLMWFLIGLVVESSVIPLEMIFEHRLYMPLFGPALLASVLVCQLFATSWPRTLFAVVGLSLVLGNAAWTRNVRWQDPVDLWTDVIVKSPSEARAWNNRGKVHLARKEQDEAIEDFTKAIELDPNLTLAYSNRGSSLALKNRFAEAVLDFTQAIEGNPKLAAAYNNRGIAYNQLGQYDRAVEDYSQAIEIAPKYIGAFHNRAISRTALGQYELAEIDASEAIVLARGHAKAYNTRGVIRQHLQKYEGSIDDLTRSIFLRPERPDAYLNRGITFALLKRFDEASLDLIGAFELNPNDVEVLYNLGVIQAKLRRFGAAIAAYQRAIELVPQHAGSRNNLAWLLATCPDTNHRNGEQAVHHANNACQLTGWQNYRALRTLAAAHAELGKFMDAVRWQQQAVKRAPAEDRDEMAELVKLYQQNRPFHQP